MAFKEALEEALGKIEDEAYRNQMRELLTKPEGQELAEGWLRQNEFDKNMNELKDGRTKLEGERTEFQTTKEGWQKWHTDEAKPAFERAQEIEANFDKEISARDTKIQELTDRFASGELDQDQENAVIKEVTTLREQITTLQQSFKDAGYVDKPAMEKALRDESKIFAENFGEVLLSLDDLNDKHQETFGKRLDRRELLKFAQEQGIQDLNDAYSKMTSKEEREVWEKDIREDERKKVVSHQGHPSDGNGSPPSALQGHLQQRIEANKRSDGLPEDAGIKEATAAAAAELREEGKVFPE